MKKTINSYKNIILREWMSARIAFTLALPYCESNREKVALLEEYENNMTDRIFATLEPSAGEYAQKLLCVHPLYSNWTELECDSSDMASASIYLARVIYDGVRADLIALHHAGLAQVESSECGEGGVMLSIRACAQVLRKVNRIIDRERNYLHHQVEAVKAREGARA